MSHAQLDGTVRRLREQMGQLLLNVQLMTREQEQDSCSDRLASMNRTLCQMLRLTDQLDLLRDLESDVSRFTPVTLDLAGLCRELCDACTYLLEQVGVSLCFDSPITSLLINGDSELLRKLLLELIVNAARAAGKGGRLTLTLARRERRAVLTLSGPSTDDGRPLTRLLSGDDTQGRIPKPGEGAGTGLLLAQRIVSLHGGTLMMERMDGMRSIVALPLTEKSGHLPVHTPRRDYSGGFSPELVALSDLLPDTAFAALGLE
jgi:signal transduction histidine kinase